MGSHRGFQSRGAKASEEQANPFKVWGLLGLGTVAVVLVGFFVYRNFFASSGFVGREVTSAEANIKKLAYIYSQYTSANGGKPPANVEEIKAWAKKLKKEKLDELAITDLEQAFISPRDNQPYVIASLKGLMGRSATVVAYEKTGVSGLRWTVSPQGGTIEMPEETLKVVAGMK